MTQADEIRDVWTDWKLPPEFDAEQPAVA